MSAGGLGGGWRRRSRATGSPERLDELAQRVADLAEQLAATVAALEREQDERIALVALLTDLPARLAAMRRLEAFFGPMLVGKEPPLNGDDVASRAYVDEAVARLARSLRRDAAPAAPAPPTPSSSKPAAKRRR